MKFEVSERIRTHTTEEELLQALEPQFKKISENAQRSGRTIIAKSIEASIGSINRNDTTTISLRRLDDGWLVIADVHYRPSVAFWIILVITLFTYIFWLVPLVFYLLQKTTVRTAIEECFQRVKNEFDQSIGMPIQVSPPLLPGRPAPPTPKLFILIADEVKGPYTREQIRALLDTGAVSADTQACREGTENWETISSFLQ